MREKQIEIAKFSFGRLHESSSTFPLHANIVDTDVVMWRLGKRKSNPATDAQRLRSNAADVRRQMMMLNHLGVVHFNGLCYRFVPRKSANKKV